MKKRLQYKVVETFSELVDMIESGKKSEVPNNGGAIVGNVLDQFTGNEGQMQTYLGFANDVGSLFLGGLTLPKSFSSLESVDEILNGFPIVSSSPSFPGIAAACGFGEDGISIYDRFNKSW